MERMMADQRAAQEAARAQYEQAMAAQQAAQRAAAEESQRRYAEQLAAQQSAQQAAAQQQAQAIARQQAEFQAQQAAAAAAQQAAMERARAEAEARAAEQKRIAEAPPAPAPNPSVTDIRPSLEIAQQLRATGRGRRKYRNDMAGAAGSSLSIPGV